MSKLRPFHIAFPIYNIDDTIKWYTKILGCTIGRQDSKWIDFNFFGHQISGHLVNKKNISIASTNTVDGHNVPVRHFGIILRPKEWKILSKRLSNNKIKFIISPNIRFKGEVGEQSTFFISDPNENVLEFKAFKNDHMIFEN